MGRRGRELMSDFNVRACFQRTYAGRGEHSENIQYSANTADMWSRRLIQDRRES